MGATGIFVRTILHCARQNTPGEFQMPLMDQILDSGNHTDEV
jgi:hypothetical protein